MDFRMIEFSLEPITNIFKKIDEDEIMSESEIKIVKVNKKRKISKKEDVESDHEKSEKSDTEEHSSEEKENESEDEEEKEKDVNVREIAYTNAFKKRKKIYQQYKRYHSVSLKYIESKIKSEELALELAKIQLNLKK